jgi:hypothetical protein
VRTEGLGPALAHNGSGLLGLGRLVVGVGRVRGGLAGRAEGPAPAARRGRTNPVAAAAWRNAAKRLAQPNRRTGANYFTASQRAERAQ